MGFSLGLHMLTRTCHGWFSLSQVFILVQRGNASLQSTGLSIYLPSDNLVKQEEPNKRKKKEKKMYLSSIFKLEIFNEPPWLFHISSCLPTRYSLSYTLFKVICVVNNHCLVEIISPLGEGLETGTLVK